MPLHSALLHLAATLPKGDTNRRALLNICKNASAITWLPGSINAVTHAGKTLVNAVIAGNWAIHKGLGGSKYSITHVPSGKSIGLRSSVKDAKETVERLVDAIPGFLHASEAELQANADAIIPALTGILPFETIMRKAGLMNLGTRYGKRGDHWGLNGGSMMIRVGGRDLVLSSFQVTGTEMQRGHAAIVGTWGMDDIEYQSKITKERLDKWIAKVKAAPTMQELRDEYRRTHR